MSFRGVQVMLDKDLAIFYEIKTIRLREQVKRNPDRFPDDFTFQLTDFEVDLLVTQNAIPSRKHLGGKHKPIKKSIQIISQALQSFRSHQRFHLRNCYLI